MKFLNTLSVLLVVLVAYSSAQQCPQNPTCTGNRDEGRQCRPHNTFHYDAASRQCRDMLYYGCGGNTNRWCTREACERRCRR